MEDGCIIAIAKTTLGEKVRKKNKSRWYDTKWDYSLKKRNTTRAVMFQNSSDYNRDVLQELEEQQRECIGDRRKTGNKEDITVEKVIRKLSK